MPPRLAAFVAPVCVAGFAVAAAAAVTFLTTAQGAATLGGVAALFLASALAERYPVPLEGIDTGGGSLSLVFFVAGIVPFGGGSRVRGRSGSAATSSPASWAGGTRRARVSWPRQSGSGSPRASSTTPAW